ncbi:YfbM family protein [Couchioplanes caeruleus]|uniref:YfbM family protein n=1 Tax=Couchioplanes caeruleus TaxID=56438 RepID=UPI0020BDD68E|nr:YfbM family protein [Couchioplanes caeruleus]UQU66563.1 YfbM family protein [Couchioplanes caeruleus]
MGMIFAGRRLTPDQVRDLEIDAPGTLEKLGEAELDLDKAWHGIHFLLTRSAWKTTPGAGEAVLGGDPVGEDTGYGPARLLTADRVAAVAAGLRDLDAAALRTRYDAAALEEAEIYPGIWDADDVFETYLGPNADQLRAFYLAAARENQAVLLTIA